MVTPLTVIGMGADDGLYLLFRATAPDEQAEHDDEENACNGANLSPSHRSISFLGIIGRTY